MLWGKVDAIHPFEETNVNPLCCLAVLVTLMFCNLSRADDTLPPPRKIETRPPPVIVPYYRVSAYAVWQHYGVGRDGFFHPLVVSTPQGAFYSYTGRPYPWTTTNERNVMPKAE